MSETSKKAREAMKRKAKSMAEGRPGERVDASSWDPSQTFSAEKLRGPRPVNPREYKSGGKVVEHISGEMPSSKNATKMSRHPTHGCRVGNKEGNYDGGTRPTGGRIARKDGGRAKSKGKTNINIIIGAGSKEPQQPMPPPPAPIRPPGMNMPPPGMMPPGGAAPMPMPPPPPAMGAMPRKSGGRIGMNRDAGSGSGVGRLEKIGKTP